MKLEKWFERTGLKFRELHGQESISDPFLQFMQSALKEYFISRVGLDPAEMNGKLMVSSILSPFEPADGENVIKLLLGIHIYGIETSFIWRSREGYKTVFPGETEFDAASLSTRIEGIDPAIVREYLGIKPAVKQYFSDLKTNYGLEIEPFNADMVFLVIRSKGQMPLQKVGEALDAAVQRWNHAHETGTSGPDLGRFHSAGIEKMDKDSLTYKLDLGTTTENGLKTLLEELNHHKIDTVRITSFP